MLLTFVSLLTGELLMLSSARDEGTTPTMVHEEVTFLTQQQQQH